MKNLFPLALIGLFLFACQSESSTKNTGNDLVLDASLEKGKDLAVTYCYSCHSPNASKENRLAPPMIGVKKHYIEEGTSEEAFTQAIIDFLNEPTEEKSKMPHAVEKFKLMPKMAFAEEDIKAIAHYIYNAEIEKPDWFDEHYQNYQENNGKQQAEVLTPLEIGLKHALATKAVLGKNLMGALSEKGTSGALAFCNTRAIHLTDSMAVEEGVAIKRVSDKPRNPMNQANAEELAYIAKAKEQLSKGEEIKPQLTAMTDYDLGYYPITTNAMCLQCHGSKENIDAETLASLNELYPEDKATGYGENELRGIWVVKMMK